VRVHALVGAICFSFAIAVFAQGSGEVAYFHLNRIKPGMTARYETTRKRHWLWHKRLGDTWSYQVWQVVQLHGFINAFPASPFRPQAEQLLRRLEVSAAQGGPS
jgi:hypothetical protein